MSGHVCVVTAPATDINKNIILPWASPAGFDKLFFLKKKTLPLPSTHSHTAMVRRAPTTAAVAVVVVLATIASLGMRGMCRSSHVAACLRVLQHFQNARKACLSSLSPGCLHLGLSCEPLAPWCCDQRPPPWLPASELALQASPRCQSMSELCQLIVQRLFITCAVPPHRSRCANVFASKLLRRQRVFICGRWIRQPGPLPVRLGMVGLPGHPNSCFFLCRRHNLLQRGAPFHAVQKQLTDPLSLRCRYPNRVFQCGVRRVLH